MNIENAKSQMRKGMLEYCILTLYPLLTRLKNDGVLAYEWQESSQGPPRKYYKLTDAGHTLLLQLDGAWRELENTVHLLKDRNLN